MDRYITGKTIRRLREERRLTQEQLAERLFVSGKAVSKWENGHGFPDISLIEPLAATLGVSVLELFSGESVQNTNRAGNVLRTQVCVCPLCGNVILTLGEAVVSCCGITLPPMEAEECDDHHFIRTEVIEDEYYVTMEHPATKEHYLSFFAGVSDMGVQMVKLYPEGTPEARLKMARVKWVYACCNRHGLFRVKV